MNLHLKDTETFICIAIIWELVKLGKKLPLSYVYTAITGEKFFGYVILSSLCHSVSVSL